MQKLISQQYSKVAKLFIESQRNLFEMKVFVKQSSRSIGFVDMHLKELVAPVDYRVKGTGPQFQNPLKQPNLFTELDPAGLQDAKDEQGNAITPFEEDVRSIVSSFTKRGRRNFDLEEPSQGIDTEKLMKAQEAGDFKLTRSAYLQFLKECRGGDLTYVRMRKNKLGRQTNVVFFGANFNDEFPSKNLYKALNLSKPDLVMVQLSPEYLLSDFK